MICQHDSFVYLCVSHAKQSFFVCHFRSKSRSVDHGLSAPFVDLDSLRSKVEGRFESIDRLSSKGKFMFLIFWQTLEIYRRMIWVYKDEEISRIIEIKLMRAEEACFWDS